MDNGASTADAVGDVNVFKTTYLRPMFVAIELEKNFPHPNLCTQSLEHITENMT